MTAFRQLRSKQNQGKEPIQNPDEILYCDGSSFMKEGKRYTGYAVVDQNGQLRRGGGNVLPPYLLRQQNWLL